MTKFIKHHYIGERNLDDNLFQFILRETDDEQENPDEQDDQLLLESVKADSNKANNFAEELMSHLILFSLYRDTDSREHWIIEITAFLKSFKEAVGADDNDKGNTNIMALVSKELDKTYDNAMKKIVKEISDSVGDTMPKNIRQKLSKALSIMKNDKYNNRTIPTNILRDLKKYFDIPELSPWTVEDFLSVKIAKKSEVDRWEKNSK